MDHAQAIARSTNMRASVVLLLGLAGVACDPDAVTEMSVEQATRVVHETEKARAAQHAAFSKCMAGCVSTEASEATDRATCRLGCGAQTEFVATETEKTHAQATMLRFDRCTENCGGPKPTDVATCRLSCAQTETRPEASGLSGENTRACSIACLEGNIACEGACQPSGDDASTCRLHCETDVTRCLAGCEPVGNAAGDLGSDGPARNR